MRHTVYIYHHQIQASHDLLSLTNTLVSPGGETAYRLQSQLCMKDEAYMSCHQFFPE